MVNRDYTDVTETPGNKVSRQAVDMARTRYSFAAAYCQGKSVLEIACGPGTGLGLLAKHARRVVAGDYTQGLLSQTKAQYGARIPLVRLDAHELPFAEGAFDVIVLFEALYFLTDFERVLHSCRSTLAPGGILLLATANPARPDFNPSALSTKYFNGSEIIALLAAHGFAAELYGGFPAKDDGVRGRLVTSMKRIAVTLDLIPKTMGGKELLKRMVFGRLSIFPAELTGSTEAFLPPERVQDPTTTTGFKVLYAVGRRIS